MSTGKFLRNLAVCALVACPLAVSCDMYDDTELREQLESLTNKVFELEQQLNSEISALKGFLTGSVSIRQVSTDEETGVTTIELSNGTKLQLHPEKDMKSFVTYITSGGVDYWAYIDKDGKKQYFLNEEGEAVPVMSEMPEVVTRDGENYIIVGGVEYPMSGNSVFSGYELVKEEGSEEVYAVTFTFGEDMTFTITLDGKANFVFVQSNGVSSRTVSELYVANSQTGQVVIQEKGTIDYVLQIPDGWRVSENRNTTVGRYLDITAPKADLVESGVAAAEGELKAVAVLAGGKATVAKLHLTTKPFKEFVVSAGLATVRMTNGLAKYVYGVCDEAVYDEAAVLAAAQSLLETSTPVAGCAVATSDIEGVSLSEIAGAELVAGKKYVFWAAPALYSEEDSEYYLEPGTVYKEVSSFGSVYFEVSDIEFRNAKVSLDISGSDSYYFNLVPERDFSLDQVVYILNTDPETYQAKTEMTYSGSVFDFTGVTAVENTGYVAWFVMPQDGRKYVAADVITRKFSTLPLAPGSSVSVVAGEPEISSADVAVTLTATGAEKIYYAYFETRMLPSFATEDEKAQYIMAYGRVVPGETAQARATDCVATVKPEMDLTLIALASDATGKYSEVIRHDWTTEEAEFLELTVQLEIIANGPDEVKASISTAGGEAVDYIYWIGKTSSATWTSSTQMNKNAESASVYMAENAHLTKFANAKRDYPIVDGVISMKDLDYINTSTKMVEKYVIVAMAQDAAGLYSKATVLEFLPHSVDLGTIVPSIAPAWTAAKNATNVNFLQQTFYNSGEIGWMYSFDVTVPQDYTAYIVSANDTWFTAGDSSVEVTKEEKMLTMISIYADKRRDTERYYDTDNNPETPKEAFYYTHEHGDPSNGSCVIWANEEFHDKTCRSETCEGTRDVEGTRYDNPGTIHHMVYYNDGEPKRLTGSSSVGNTGVVFDKVYIVLQDLDGNCYEPIEYGVPYDWFEGGAGYGVDPGDLPDNSGE